MALLFLYNYLLLLLFYLIILYLAIGGMLNFTHTLFPRATSQVAACRHLATAARVKYPAALQRCKFDTPLFAAGYLICAAVR